MKKIIILTCLMLALCFAFCGCEKRAAKATGKIDKIENLDLKFDYKNNDAYKVGKNNDGKPVFYDAKAAIKQAKIDYADGILYLQTEYGLKDFEEDYEAYGEYGWQVEATDDGIVKQCEAITSFVDVYKNSYN